MITPSVVEEKGYLVIFSYHPKLLMTGQYTFYIIFIGTIKSCLIGQEIGLVKAQIFNIVPLEKNKIIPSVD